MDGKNGVHAWWSEKHQLFIILCGFNSQDLKIKTSFFYPLGSLSTVVNCDKEFYIKFFITTFVGGFFIKNRCE